MDDPPPLTGLGEEARAVALARYRVLRPHLDEGVPLTRSAEAAGVPLRTAQRWLARYRAGGFAALARPARADRGQRRIPAELQSLIEGLALRRPAPSMAAIHRLASDVAAAHNWSAPSYACVYDIVPRSIPRWSFSPRRVLVGTRRRSTSSCGGRPRVPTTSGRPTTPSLTFGSSAPAASRPGRG